MKPKLDMDKIANALGAEREGKVAAKGGYFGALQLAAEVGARFRVPASGGRPTDPAWTERRLVPLAPRTLQRLSELADHICRQCQVRVEPMQLAGLILEKTAEWISAEEARQLVQRTKRKQS